MDLAMVCKVQKIFKKQNKKNKKTEEKKNHLKMFVINGTALLLSQDGIAAMNRVLPVIWLHQYIYDMFTVTC